jgi:hypothetical protein
LLFVWWLPIVDTYFSDYCLYKYIPVVTYTIDIYQKTWLYVLFLFSWKDFWNVFTQFHIQNMIIQCFFSLSMVSSNIKSLI